MSEKLQKIIALLVGVLTLTLTISYLILAWTEPSQAPPGGNIPAPINVGTSAQTKTGDLNIGGGLAYWITKSGDSFALKNDAGSTTFVIGQDGYVGIGTTNPLGKLHVNFGAPGVNYVRITNDVNNIAILGDNTAPNDRGTLFLYYNGALKTLISASNSYFNGGNVGIGTTSPGYNLDVSGAIRLQPSTIPTGANGVIYYDSGTNKFRCYQNGVWTDCIGAGATANYWTLTGSNLYPNDTAWNVGIGTTSPGYKLDVNGNVSATRFYASNNADAFYSYDQTCPLGWSCHIRTWDIAAQSLKLYGYADFTGNLTVGSGGAGYIYLGNRGYYIGDDLSGNDIQTNAPNFYVYDGGWRRLLRDNDGFGGDVSGTYNNLQLGAGVVGNTEVSFNYAGSASKGGIANNSAQLNGQSASYYLNTSATSQTKSGSLTVNGTIYSGWELKTSSQTIPGGGVGSGGVLCSSGTKVIGGGCAWNVVYDKLLISISKPRSDGNGWSCGGNNTSASSYQLISHAICARIGP